MTTTTQTRETSVPAWRCSCPTCRRITLRQACDTHRLVTDAALLAALTGEAHPATTAPARQVEQQEVTA